MSQWIRLNSLDSLQRRRTSPDCVVGVVLSPYDVPDAVRGERAGSGRFKIEFRYIDGEEPGKVVHLGDHLNVIEGTHSGRLLGMEIDVDAIGAGSVGVSISTKDVGSIKQVLDLAWEKVRVALSNASEKQEMAATTRLAVEGRERELAAQLVDA